MTRPATARRTAEIAARFIRLFSLGATLLALLTGFATGHTGGSSIPVGPLLWTLLVGVLFHVHANVANDVMDLPIDRTDPRRAPDPLVRGLVPAPHALLVAITALVVLLACLLATPARAAFWPMVGAVVLVGCYNLAGKLVPVPLVADAVEGAGGACLVLAGGALAGGATPVTWWAAGFALVYIMMINGLHGAVRDVHNDRLAGARTTAVLAGVQIRDGRSVAVPVVVAGWGAALQLALGGLLAGVLFAGLPAPPPVAWLVSAATAAVVFGLSTLALLRAWHARADLRRAMAEGTWHLVLAPAALLAAVAWRIPLWAVGLAAAAYVAPPLLFGWAVRGTQFGLPSTTVTGPPAGGRSRRDMVAGLWQMTRIGTPLAAAGLVGAGAVIGGGFTRTVGPAMVAMALAVAAANVYNDRCDALADAMNDRERPLPAGTVTEAQADRFVLAVALGVVVSASPGGVAATVVAGLLLVLGLAYSVLLRRVVILGHASVAALFAAPLLYGGWLSPDGLRGPHWAAAVLVALYVFGREILKGIPDRRGDQAAGYRTIATEWGLPVALAVFRSTALAFCAGAVAAVLLADRTLAYLAAATVCALAPTMRTLWLVRGTPSPTAVNAAIAFSGLVFGLGLVPLLLLG
jgi:4-hydroxybenzoate polyprenyltransferase